jgi:hypothetical protein
MFMSIAALPLSSLSVFFPLTGDRLPNSCDKMEEVDDSKIFPQRLMEILNDEQANGESICWLPHGRAFVVRSPALFTERILPRYFSRTAKYSSFTRRLNRWCVQWNFKRSCALTYTYTTSFSARTRLTGIFLEKQSQELTITNTF